MILSPKILNLQYVDKVICKTSYIHSCRDYLTNVLNYPLKATVTIMSKLSPDRLGSVNYRLLIEVTNFTTAKVSALKNLKNINVNGF